MANEKLLGMVRTPAIVKDLAAGRGLSHQAINELKLGITLGLGILVLPGCTPGASPTETPITPSPLGFGAESVDTSIPGAQNIDGIMVYDGFILSPSSTQIKASIEATATAPAANYEFTVTTARTPSGELLPIRFAQYENASGQTEVAPVWPVTIKGATLDGIPNIEGVQFYTMKPEAIGQQQENGNVPISLDRSNLVKPLYSIFYQEGKTNAAFQSAYQQLVDSGKGNDNAAISQLLDDYVYCIAIADPNAADEAAANKSAIVMYYENADKNAIDELIALLTGAKPAYAASVEPSVTLQAGTPTPGGAATPTPAVPSVEPTAEPTAVAPQTFEQWIQQNQKPNEALAQQVVAPYLSAMGTNPETIQLQPKVIEGANGPFAVIVDASNNVPLLISVQDTQGNWQWVEATPGNIGELRWGMDIGINYGNALAPGVREKAAKFGMQYVSYDMTWALTEPAQGQVTFHTDNGYAYPDREVQYATDHGQTVMAGQLISTGQFPAWLVKGIDNGTFSPEQVREFVRNRITTMMERYKDRVSTWVVVNEYHPNEWGWSDDPVQRSMGNYVEYAFQVAREVDPNATLLYNDCGNETPDLGSYQQNIDLAKSLHDKGLIDGIGIQMHLLRFKDHIPTYQELLNTFNIYKQNGVPVYITEMDVNMQHISGTDAQLREVGIDPAKLPSGTDQQTKRMMIQAQIYRNAIRAAIDSQNVESITFFTIGDNYSWLNQVEGPESDGTLFDDQLDPKQSYYAVLQELLRP